MTEEIWKPVSGYEGLYEVSNKGRVKSLPRTSSDGKPVIGKIRKLSVSTNGYLQLSLSKNGINTIYRVHRLVAEAFLPNPDKKYAVNHKDETRTNNCVENLEWMSSKENCNYGTRNTRLRDQKHEIYQGRRRGVAWHIRHNKWRAALRISKKMLHLGYFDNKEEAYQAFYNKYIEIFGSPPW